MFKIICNTLLSIKNTAGFDMNASYDDAGRMKHTKLDVDLHTPGSLNRKNRNKPIKKEKRCKC